MYKPIYVFFQSDLTRILAKDAGDDDFIESDEEVDPELMAEKVYEDADELREDKRKRQLGAMKVSIGILCSRIFGNVKTREFLEI